MFIPAQHLKLLDLCRDVRPEEGDDIIVDASLPHILFQYRQLLTEPMQLKSDLISLVVRQLDGGQDILPLMQLFVGLWMVPARRPWDTRMNRVSSW